MNENSNQICRLCLDDLKDGAFASIFLFPDGSDSKLISWSRMLITFAAVTVSENDGLPSNVCRGCIGKLESAYFFKEQCERSYDVLLESRAIVKKEMDDSEEQISVDHLHPECKLEIFYEDHPAPTTDSDNNSESNYPIQHFKEKKSRTIKKIRINGKKGMITKKSEKTQYKKSVESLGIDLKGLMKVDGVYQCDTCPKTFKSRRSVVTHLEKHLGIKSYFCEICNKHYTKEWVHKQTHIRPKYPQHFQCDQCGRKFETRPGLVNHLLSHSDIKPFVCDDCGKGFKRRDRLNFHKKIHGAVKDFMCQFCSKEFHFQKNLIIHIKYKHSNTRDFECLTCKKRFVTQHCLKMHERRHLGIKNFKCNCCKKTFVTREGLDIHCKSHQNENFIIVA